MSFESILEKLNEQAGNISPIGAKVKFVLDEHTIFVDGTGDKNVVSNDDNEADCVISTTMDTFQKLKSGDLNPMMAVMTGKIKIKGDMGIAMKLQSLLS
jgi:putative sterol carrier protein